MTPGALGGAAQFRDLGIDSMIPFWCITRVNECYILSSSLIRVPDAGGSLCESMRTCLKRAGAAGEWLS